MRLHTAGTALGFRKPLLVRITTESLPVDERKDTALVVSSLNTIPTDCSGYAALILQQNVDVQTFSVPVVHSVREVEHLRSGHVVALEPGNGFVRTLYRPESRHNTLFATERCSSNCLMCSQPPSDRDD